MIAPTIFAPRCNANLRCTSRSPNRANGSFSIPILLCPPGATPPASRLPVISFPADVAQVPVFGFVVFSIGGFLKKRRRSVRLRDDAEHGRRLGVRSAGEAGLKEG